MFCPNCGKPVEEEAKFCPYCGAGLVPGASPAQLSTGVAWQAAQTMIVQTWAGGASLALMASYMVFNAVVYGLGALLIWMTAGATAGISGAMGGIIGGETPSPVGELRRTETLLALLSVVLIVGAILAGASATGLFARRRWGRTVTRTFLGLDVILNLGLLLLIFSPAVLIRTLFAVGVAVLIWIHLGHPRVEALLKAEE